MRISVLLLFFYLSAFYSNAQQISFQQITNPVVAGLKNPWAGGFNSVQFFPIDLDGDAREDLVVFDRSAQHVKTFLRNATGGFTYAPAYQTRFPLVENWMNLLDYDGDGDKDLFASTPGGIQVYPNVGNNFPAGSPHLVPSLPSASPLDIDGDGALDLIASSHLPDLNPSLETTSFYRSENGQLILKMKAFLQEEMIDVGDNASPVFFDVEGDGDLDLLIGSSSVTLYENVSGTLSLKSRDFLPLTGALNIQLQVVNGRLMLYYLKGSAVYYREYKAGVLNEEKPLPVVSLRETPRLYDVNQDGSLELVVLDYLGGTRVYDWSDLSKPYQRKETLFRGIAYADITGDGNFGQNAQISIADFNRDGKVDIVIGLASGGVQLVQNTSEILIPSDELYVWPNPASFVINIRVKSAGTLHWYDLSGRELGSPISVNAGETLRIPAPLMGAGIYILRYESASGLVTKKVLIQP